MQKELPGGCWQPQPLSSASLRPQVPHPGRSLPPAAFNPDSFYDSKAQGYEAQHTPGEIRVLSGWRERVGRLGFRLATSPLLGGGHLALQGQCRSPRGCTGTLVSQGAAEGEAKLNHAILREGIPSPPQPPSCARRLMRQPKKVNPPKMEVKTEEERARPVTQCHV